MIYTMDFEYFGGDIFQDFHQTESDPIKKAIEIMGSDLHICSIAVRDENRKLVKIVDWRDLDEHKKSEGWSFYEEAQEG